jgi:hypothetical protein
MTGPDPSLFSEAEGGWEEGGTRVCVECLIGKQKKPILFKVTEPSSIPYRTHPACAKRAAYSDPPPVIPVPDTGVAHRRPMLRLYCPGPLRPEMFSGIGSLPEPATESHVTAPFPSQHSSRRRLRILHRNLRRCRWPLRGGGGLFFWKGCPEGEPGHRTV